MDRFFKAPKKTLLPSKTFKFQLTFRAKIEYHCHYGINF